jgi:hypothetical protein
MAQGANESPDAASEAARSMGQQSLQPGELVRAVREFSAVISRLRRDKLTDGESAALRVLLEELTDYL